jgi:hypothetical protein
VDLLGRGLDGPGHPESVHRTVTRDLDGGGTILLHDPDCTAAPGAWHFALGALPRILGTCSERGFEVGRGWVTAAVRPDSGPRPPPRLLPCPPSRWEPAAAGLSSEFSGQDEEDGR